MLKKLSFDFLVETFWLFSHCATKAGHAFGSGGAGKDGIDGDSGAGGRLGKTAGDGELGGFGHAIMDHFDRDLQAGFAGDENDPAPVLFQHFGKIESAQADAAHDVGLE